MTLHMDSIFHLASLGQSVQIFDLPSFFFSVLFMLDPSIAMIFFLKREGSHKFSLSCSNKHKSESAKNKNNIQTGSRTHKNKKKSWNQ